MDQQNIIESSREIPVVNRVDVAVVGGGTAGVMAAVGAAREGANTCLIERFGSLGGMINVGLMGHFGNLFRDKSGQHDLISGAPRELLEKIVASGATPYATLEDALRVGYQIFYRHEHAGYACLQMLEEAKVQLWLQARFCRALPAPEGGFYLFLECKDGRKALYARQVVDCTGEADVANSLGAAMRDKAYSWGLLFEMGLVDLKKYEKFLAQCPVGCPEWTDWLANYLGESAESLKKDAYWGDWLDGGKRAWLFRSQIMKAVEAGDFDLVRNLPEGGMIRYGWDGFWPEPWHGDDVVTANVCMITGLDPANGRHVSAAEAAARKYAFDFLAFYRKYIPGFEKAVIRVMSSQVVPRGGREIVGETLPRFDHPAGFIGDDAICVIGLGTHGLPLGMFVPRGFSNLLVAGRCADSGYAVRGSVSCMAQGYSCGIIAALAVKQGVTPMKLDISERRRALESHGVILSLETALDNPRQLHEQPLLGVPAFDIDDGLKRAKKLS